MNEYLDLFGTFAKVGVMTFGGGYAMLPILQREVVEHKGSKSFSFSSSELRSILMR